MNSLLEALVLGLIAGAVPGPILTGTFAEILSHGLLKGIRVVIWALIAETLGAFVIIFFFYKLGLSDLFIQIISVCGAVVLFWIATKVWKITQVTSESKALLTPSKIFLLTALNSGYWIFWITIGVPKALLLDQTVIGGRFIYLSLFEIAWLIMTLLLAFIFFKFRPLLQKQNLVGITFKILASILVLLGIKTIFSVF